MATDQLSVPETECLQKLKAALATAIIRNKPSGLTSKEYASRLSEQLRCREQNWKAKAKRLEEELLQTKQELILAELSSKERKGVNLEDEFFNAEFGDCQPSTSDANFAVSVLTPPSSSEALSQESYQEKVFFSNTNFLSSLCKLESALCQTDCELPFGGTSDVIKHSIQNMSACYQNWVELSHLPKPAIEKGPLTIVRVLDSSILDGHRQEVIDECKVLIQRCVRAILSCRKICRTDFLTSVITLVTSLAKSPHLRGSTLVLLTKQFRQIGDNLRTAISHQTTLDPVVCENVICLFQMFEDILDGYRPKGNHLIGEKEVLKELKDQLENCVLHLMEVFPLFTQYVWNILGIMELMDRDSAE